jgi:hypothetical protein
MPLGLTAIALRCTVLTVGLGLELSHMTSWPVEICAGGAVRTNLSTCEYATKLKILELLPGIQFYYNQ